MRKKHFKGITELSKTQENVAVGVVAVLLAALLFILVGWDGIKNWFSKPLIWRDPDYITAEAELKTEADGKIDLLIFVINASSNRITKYDLDIVCGSAVCSFGGTSGWETEHVLTKRILAEKDGRNASFYEALTGKDVEDIALKVHVRSLYSGDEKLVKQTGLVKIIGLAVISVASGLLVAGELVGNRWLRMLLKLLCVPSLVLFFGAILVLSAAGSSGNRAESGGSASESHTRGAAAENYKRQAGYKAGAVMTGRQQDAARAQGQMDKSFADMISPGNSEAKKEYQRQAQLKAGAVMTGRPQDAARAQGQMDKAFADMIAASNSQAKKRYQYWAQMKANAEMRGSIQDAAFAQQQMDRYMADMLNGK
ncbi:MAG: hypothetical protein IJK23_00620 [Clostridia bacterium]|nr:hypothetical protein [Clostridia bacterium]